MPSVTLHPPGMAVPGVAGCGGSQGLVGVEKQGVGGAGGGGGGGDRADETVTERSRKPALKRIPLVSGKVFSRLTAHIQTHTLSHTHSLSPTHTHTHTNHFHHSIQGCLTRGQMADLSGAVWRLRQFRCWSGTEDPLGGLGVMFRSRWIQIRSRNGWRIFASPPGGVWVVLGAEAALAEWGGGVLCQALLLLRAAGFSGPSGSPACLRAPAAISLTRAFHATSHSICLQWRSPSLPPSRPSTPQQGQIVGALSRLFIIAVKAQRFHRHPPTLLRMRFPPYPVSGSEGLIHPFVSCPI